MRDSCRFCGCEELERRTGSSATPRGTQYWAALRCLGCGREASASADTPEDAIDAAMDKFDSGEEDDA